MTGVDYSTEEFMKTGARIWNLERLFNLKAGLTGEDDTLPPRLLNDPIKTGPSKGEVSNLDEMLPEYYAAPRLGRDGSAHQGQADGAGALKRRDGAGRRKPPGAFPR